MVQAVEKQLETGGELDKYEIEGPDRAELLQDLGEFQLAAVGPLPMPASLLLRSGLACGCPPAIGNRSCSPVNAWPNAPIAEAGSSAARYLSCADGCGLCR